MPQLEPFRAVRYDASIPLDQVISPPYDVIDSHHRENLARRHPSNAVRVDLPEAPEGIDRYRQAADLMAAWLRLGIVHRDPNAALYVYRMRLPGGAVTTGVIGALRLPDAGSDDVRPHEETLAKPLGDRLELLRAMRTNTSPVWLLSLARGLSSLLPTTAEPTARATDDDRAIHELWKIEDGLSCERITTAVSSAPLVVADGHHRYQTALAYRKERALVAGTSARGGDHGSPDGANLLMTYVVELSPLQLRVGAIHRLLGGPPSAEKVLDTVRAHFEVVRAGPLSSSVVSAIETSGNLGLLTPDAAWLLSPREPVPDEVLDPDLVEPVLAELSDPPVTYAHRAEEAATAVREGQATAALLLRPVGVDKISSWAADHRRMPPKTTYFYPKPRTGMLFRLLDE